MPIQTVYSEITQTTQTYHRLRNDLLDGRLAPGSKLKIKEIAAGYGVGATPIREALSSLAAEGLVKRMDQRGFRAAPATLAEFEDLLRSRCWLEEACLRQSILAGDREWEDKLVLTNYRLSCMDNALPLSQQPDFKSTHHAFHAALLSACPAPPLLEYCEALSERARRYLNLARLVSFPARNAKAEHDAITQAALARDANKACRLLIEHHNTSAKYVRLALAVARKSAWSGPRRG